MTYGEQEWQADTPDGRYGPEVHVCSFLDQRYASSAPHFVYAYYARAFTVPLLARLYRQFVESHSVAAIVLVDGGSDSIMAGDEEGLGDPIEDAVSVTAVASLKELKARVLISIGLGTDRFNQVSDAASLRAIAELTRMGGFLGAVGLEPAAVGSRFYRDCLEHVYQRQGFRSVLAGTIASAVEGCFGREEVPPVLQQRVRPGQLFLWPLRDSLPARTGCLQEPRAPQEAEIDGYVANTQGGRCRHRALEVCTCRYMLVSFVLRG